MSKRLLAWLCLMTFLAGCAGGAPKTAPTTSVAPPPAPTAEFGTVAGTLLNEEQLPVRGGRVGIIETQNETTSDADGAFVINGLPPGTYRLLAEALGFEPVGRSVDVVAGEVTDVTITLKALEVGLEPFIEMVPYVGMIQCSVNPQYAIYPCEGVTGTSKAAFDFFHNSDYALEEAVVEAVWTATNPPVGEELELDICKYAADRMKTLCDGALAADGQDNYKYKTGASPLTIRADKLDDKKNNHWIVGAGAGLGSPPTYQQAFTIYVSLCYLEACAEEYSAIPA